MNVYDTVNRLAAEIKESPEYINFKEAKQKIAQNSEYRNKISEFEKLRYEEQIETIQSGKPNEEKMAKIQNLYKELIDIPEVKTYFDTEFKFNDLIGDVNKAISEAISDVIS